LKLAYSWRASRMLYVKGLLSASNKAPFRANRPPGFGLAREAEPGAAEARATHGRRCCPLIEHLQRERVSRLPRRLSEAVRMFGLKERLRILGLAARLCLAKGSGRHFGDKAPAGAAAAIKAALMIGRLRTSPARMFDAH
jgi:hypothetical protein